MANAYTLIGGSAGGEEYTGDNPITPTNNAITIPTETTFDANLVVKGDSNLVASNIMQGKTIFGVSGTAIPVDYSYDEGYGVAYLGTSVSGYTRYKITSISYT